MVALYRGKIQICMVRTKFFGKTDSLEKAQKNLVAIGEAVLAGTLKEEDCYERRNELAAEMGYTLPAKGKATVKKHAKKCRIKGKSADPSMKAMKATPMKAMKATTMKTAMKTAMKATTPPRPDP